MTRFDFFFLTMCFLYWGPARYFWKRNDRTHAFMKEKTMLTFEWSNRHIEEIANKEAVSAFIWIDPYMPSYQQVWLSFKPLTLEAWFPEEIIEKLKS